MKFTILFFLMGSTLYGAGQGQLKIRYDRNYIGDVWGNNYGTEVGSLTVPSDRGVKGSPLITIPFIRFKSKASDPADPIVFLAGGPGQSGLDVIMKGPLFAYAQALTRIADVFVFDQRGTGAAMPSLMVNSTLNLPLDKSVLSRESLQALDDWATGVHEELAKRDINANVYNTSENAEDLESLRIALGAGKLNIWAHSYGTHLALAYLRKHGDKVARCVLGGVNGLDHRMRLPLDSETILQRVDSLVKTDPYLNARMPDFLGTARRVLNELDSKPIVADVLENGINTKITLYKMDVCVALIIKMGEIETIRRLPDLIGKIERRDGSEIARLVLEEVKRRPTGTAMTYAMIAASGVSNNRLEKMQSQKSQALFGNAINYPFAFLDLNRKLEVRDLGESFREPVITDVPTLFLCGYLDGRTGLQDAEEVARAFSHLKQINVVGGSHDFYSRAPVLIKHMKDFFSGNEATIPSQIDIPFWFYDGDSVGCKQLILAAREKGIETALQEYDVFYGKTLTVISNPEILNQAANFFLKDGKIGDAEKVLRFSVTQYNFHMRSFDQLSKIYLDQKRIPEALEMAKRARALNPFYRNPAFSKYKKVLESADENGF